MDKPLEGVKVVDLSYYVAGPGAARMLADWGADVIKVEAASGDPNRTVGSTIGTPITDEINPWFCTWNVNKRGIAVNLKSEEGRKVMDRLLAQAHVFMSNFRPQALKKLGLDYDSLHERYPQLVWAAVNGFGDRGPAKDDPGFDMVAYWARSGAMLDLMEKDTAPIIPPIGYGDSIASGSLAAGICAALYRQKTTGEGSRVNVSLFGQAIWNMAALICSKDSGVSYPRSRKAPGNPAVNSYRSKDGKWMFTTLFDERMLAGLYRALDREDLLEDERFANVQAANQHAEELTAILEEAFALFTAEELDARLSEADVPHSALAHGFDVPDDPQALENHYVVSYRHRNGETTPLSMTPVIFGDGEEEPELREAPLVGEHTEEVLKELGYTEEEIAELVDAKAVCRL